MAAIRNITTDELDAVRLHLGRPLHAKYIMPDPTQFSVLSVYKYNASSLGLIEPASNRTPKGVCVLFEFDPMRVGIPLKQMWHYRFLLTYFPSFLSFFPIKRERGGGGRELRPNLRLSYLTGNYTSKFRSHAYNHQHKKGHQEVRALHMLGEREEKS